MHIRSILAIFNGSADIVHAVEKENQERLMVH